MASTDTADSRRWRRDLGRVVLLGAVIRVTMLGFKWKRDLKLNDSLWYHVVALDITKGRWFQSPFETGPSAEHPPLTSIVVAPLSFLPDPLFGQRITTTLLGIVAVAVVAIAARRIGGHTVGVVSGGIAAMYPNMWLSDGLVMSESLTMLLVGLFLLLALRMLDSPTAGRGLILGVVCGLAALTRSELMLLGPLFAVVMWRRHRWAVSLRPLASAAAAGLIVLSPWLTFNLIRFERTVLLTNNDGTTLLGANCDDVYSGGDKGGWSLFCVLREPEIDGDESVRAAARRNAGLRYAYENVERAPVVVAARVLRGLDLYGVSDMVRGDVGEERPLLGAWAGVAMAWVLIPLAALGLWRRRDTARQVLLIPVIIVSVTTVVFYGVHRLRAPAEPVICIAAALALVRLVPRLRSNDDHRASGAIAAMSSIGGAPAA